MAPATNTPIDKINKWAVMLEAQNNPFSRSHSRTELTISSPLGSLNILLLPDTRVMEKQ